MKLKKLDMIVKAVTTTREKAGDGLGDIRKVLTLETQCDVQHVIELLSTVRDRLEFQKRYWDDDGNLLIEELDESIALDRELEGGLATLTRGCTTSGVMNLKGVDVRNVRLHPQQNSEVTLKLALHCNPTEEQCGKLDWMLGGNIEVEFDRAQAEMELTPKQEETGGETAAMH